MILVIDNYDSFIYNLVQYFGELGEQIIVKRNNKITVNEITKNKKIKGICISPGPCTPNEAGISTEIIKKIPQTNPKIPILGVCLGHQCIGQSFGSKITHAPEIYHGKTSEISLKTSKIFKNLPKTITVGRYHSLHIDPQTLSLDLKITATIKKKNTKDEDLIMAVEHTKLPIYGVQFHPESILTPHGKKIIQNFIKITRES